MAASKTPPRFVPTLTDVVQLPGNGQQHVPAKTVQAMATPPEPALSSRSPAVPQVSASPPPPSESSGTAAVMDGLPYGFEEYVVHRVLQRVDVVLDQRLREAIALVVQEQTRSMVPRLREEVESVVRHAVYEAVAEELVNQRNDP